MSSGTEATFGEWALGIGYGLKIGGAFAEMSINRRLAKTDERIARWMAKDAEFRGAQQQSLLKHQTGRLYGRQRASFAGQNVTLDDGSALDVQEDAARMLAIDLGTLRNNTAREAWGWRVEEMAARYRGKVSQWEGLMKVIGSAAGLAYTAYDAGYFGDSGGKPPYSSQDSSKANTL